MFGVISASYTDKGGSAGQAPPLSTTSQVQIRQKHQEVEHVVTQSGTTTATNTDTTGVGGQVHRNSLAATDWLQLNGPFNLHQINSISIRVRRWRRRPHGRLAAGGDRHPPGLDHGSDRGHGDLTSTGAADTWATRTVPITVRPRASTSCSSRSARSRTGRPAAACST